MKPLPCLIVSWIKLYEDVGVEFFPQIRIFRVGMIKIN